MLKDQNSWNIATILVNTIVKGNEDEEIHRERPYKLD